MVGMDEFVQQPLVVGGSKCHNSQPYTRLLGGFEDHLWGCVPMTLLE